MMDIIKNKKYVFTVIIYTFLLSISFSLKSIMNKYNDLQFFNFIIIKDILFFILCFIMCFIFNIFILSKIKDINLKNNSNFDSKKLFIVSFISMFIIYIICLITYFPGGSFYDTFFQLDTPIGATTQHPLFYNLILNIFVVQIGYKLLKNSIIGFLLYSIVQMIIVISSISYFIVWLNNKKINKKIIVLLIMLFTLLPVYGAYSIFATKDVIFSIIVMLFIPLLYDLVNSKGELFKDKKFCIKFIIYSFILVFTRSNGIYVFIVLSLLLLIKYFKQSKKFLTIFTVFILCSNFILSYSIDKVFNIEHYFKENAAIPLQQLAATISEDGKVLEKDEKFINNIIQISEIKNKYNREDVDPIKWNDKFNDNYLNDNKVKFIKTWFSVLKDNFDIYVESYLYQTKNYWQVNLKSVNTNMYKDVFKIDTKSDKIETVKAKYNLNSKSKFNNNNKLIKFYNKYVNFISEGACILLLLFLICLLLIKGQKQYIICFTPLLIIWITLMISVPLSSSLRYMYSFVLSLPFSVIICLNLENNN